jgi:tetratricopeptide (TPR) repeat protein
LEKARDLYDHVIDFYRRGAAKDLDKLYLKLSYFYRADCVYDLGKYPEAIKLYGEAAFAYKDDPSAVAAYVQIINANVAQWEMCRKPRPPMSGPSGCCGACRASFSAIRRIFDAEGLLGRMAEMGGGYWDAEMMEEGTLEALEEQWSRVLSAAGKAGGSAARVRAAGIPKG